MSDINATGEYRSSRTEQPAPETPSKCRKRVQDDLQDENASSPVPPPPPHRSPRGGLRSPHAQSPHRRSSVQSPNKLNVHRISPRTTKKDRYISAPAFDDQPLVFSRGAERERQRIKSHRPLVTQRPKSATSSLFVLPHRDRRPFATPRRGEPRDATPVRPVSSDARSSTPHVPPPSLPPPRPESEIGLTETFTLSSLTNMLMSAPREREPPRVSSPFTTPLHHPLRPTSGPTLGGPSTKRPFSTPLFNPSSSSRFSGFTSSSKARTDPRPFCSEHLVPHPHVDQTPNLAPRSSPSRCPLSAPILKRQRTSSPASPLHRAKQHLNGVRLRTLARRAQEEDLTDSSTEVGTYDSTEESRTSMTDLGKLDLPVFAPPSEPAPAHPSTTLLLSSTHAERGTNRVSSSAGDVPTGSGPEKTSAPDSAIKRLIANRIQRRKNRTVQGGLVDRAINVLQRARSQHVLWAAEQQTPFHGRLPLSKPVPTIFQEGHVPNSSTSTTATTSLSAAAAAAATTSPKSNYRSPTLVVSVQSVLCSWRGSKEEEVSGPTLARCVVPSAEHETSEQKEILVLFSPCFSHTPSLESSSVSGDVRSALWALGSCHSPTTTTTPNQHPIRIAMWDGTSIPISHPAVQPSTEIMLCTRFALHKA